MAKGDKLTPKQLAFVREYLICRNGTQAAIKAGYSKKTANEQAARLLANVSIKALVEKNEKKVEEKFEITQEKIVQELAAIAFGHAGNVMNWTESHVHLIPKKQLAEKDLKFVESVKETTTEFGGSLEMKTLAGQKTKALELLGKHVGMWKDKDAGTGTDSESRKALLGRLSELTRKRRERGSGSGAAET